MEQGTVANANLHVRAPLDRVWRALITPADIKQYFFGTEVASDWREGSPITWKGEYQGKRYEDKGVILKFRPMHTLQYSHFSPLSGQPDLPENYHTVTIKLSAHDGGTAIALSQDHHSSEEARKHSEDNWKAVLEGLRRLVE